MCVCVWAYGSNESNGNNCNKVIKQNSAKNSQKKGTNERYEKTKIRKTQLSYDTFLFFVLRGEFNMFYYIIKV